MVLKNETISDLSQIEGIDAYLLGSSKINLNSNEVRTNSRIDKFYLMVLNKVGTEASSNEQIIVYSFYRINYRQLKKASYLLNLFDN